jgi:hypothetical protein
VEGGSANERWTLPGKGRSCLSGKDEEEETVRMMEKLAGERGAARRRK